MDTDRVLAFSRGDFSVLPLASGATIWHAEAPAAGAMRLRATAAQGADRLLLSVGVHGDETGPIELLASVLEELVAGTGGLAIDLLVVVANLEAIALGKRFLRSDLNRLFTEPGPGGSSEAARAAQLCRLTRAFFADAPARRVHLDLHSTIKPSLYPCFAVLPHEPSAIESEYLEPWLALAKLQAMVFSKGRAATYSAFSARECGATAATLELGARGPLGENDLASMASVAAALARMLRNGLAPPVCSTRLPRFRATREIIRKHRDFQFNLAGDMPNFTSFGQGDLIARDGNEPQFALEDEERILFPNAEVALGARAGVMIVPVG